MGAGPTCVPGRELFGDEDPAAGGVRGFEGGVP